MMSSHTAKVIVSPQEAIGSVLSHLIIQSCQSALSSRKSFTIALSGGSLPTFLERLSDAFQSYGVDPHWDKWHVLLADERCVVSSDSDSNLRSIRESFTSGVSIPSDQVYGIDEDLLGSSEKMARAYAQEVLLPLLEKSDGMLDCVVLGFGPDGHTCSLFPGHQLLNESTLLVSHIDDSPKPPPSRITLTLPTLNKFTRQVIFCGVGASKSPILRAVFESSTAVQNDQIKSCQEVHRTYSVMLKDPAPYPCGLVRPEQGSDPLVWVVDEEAARESFNVIE